MFQLAPLNTSLYLFLHGLQNLIFQLQSILQRPFLSCLLHPPISSLSPAIQTSMRSVKGLLRQMKRREKLDHEETLLEQKLESF